MLFNLKGTTILIILFILNLFINSLYILYPELSHDEPFSLYHALLPVLETIHRLSSDNNPPLYEVVLHFYIKFFGDSLFATRFLSNIFICSANLINGLLMLRFFGKRAAYISSILFIFSSYYLGFSHETRGYALFLFLIVSAIYLLFLIIEKCETIYTIKDFIKFYKLLSLLFILDFVCLLCSHYMSVFVVATVCIYILYLFSIKSISFSTLKILFILSLVVLIIYFPQLLIFVTNALKVSKGGTWLNPPEFSDLYNMLWKFSNSPVATVSLLFPLLFIPAYKSLWHQKQYMFFVFMFWLPFITVFFLSFKMPLFHDRYMIIISPFFYNLISMNIYNLISRIKSNLKYISIIPITIYIFSFNIKGKEPDKLENAIQLTNTKTTCYIVCPKWYNYTFYYYFEKGIYFKKIFDYNHQEPKNVFFDYNLSAFSFECAETYNHLNIILSGDPNQSSFDTFNHKLSLRGFELDTTFQISKVSKSYVYHQTKVK